MQPHSSFATFELPGGRRLVRDEQHGYIKVVPRPSAEELEAFYARAYTNPCVPHDPAGRMELVADLLPAAGRVLDIGCGRGELLSTFAAAGWQVVGVEPGIDYVEAARARGIDVVHGMLTADVAATLGQFDAVLLMHVLEHLPDPEGMIRLVRGLLKPGGVLYCEVPNDFNALQDAAVHANGLRPWWIAVPDHLNYFSIASLSSFLAAQGFDIVRETTDFPVEMFLLWGDVYVDNPEAGRAMHARRCRFEQAMRAAGYSELLRTFYERIATLGMGREAIVCARRPTA